MGVCTNGDIQIELQTVEDADYVYDQIDKIVELTKARMKLGVADFNLQDNHVDGTIFRCNVYSDRIQNGEFQVEQVLEQVKVMVKKNHILPPYNFTGELLVQQAAWYMDENEFNTLE